MNGIELLRAARELFPEVEVIMMTAFANVDTAREAFYLAPTILFKSPSTMTCEGKQSHVLWKRLN